MEFRNIIQCLNQYEKVSRQQINYEKSTATYSPNTDANLKEKLSGIILLRESETSVFKGTVRIGPSNS